MFTTALAFLSFMVLNISYSVGYNVYASLTTSNSNTMDTTTMEMKRGNIAMGFNQYLIRLSHIASSRYYVSRLSK